MSTKLKAYQETRTVYFNLNLAIDNKDWDAVQRNTLRLGQLTLELGSSPQTSEW